MKRFVVLFSMFLFVSLLPCSAKIVSKEVEAFLYSGDKPLYPAIIYSIVHGEKSHFKDAKIANVDIAKNAYIINDVSGSDGLKLVRFTLTITVNNGTLVYEISNRSSKGIKDKSYSPTKSFLMFDERVISNNFNTIMPTIMNDDAMYETAKQEASAYIGKQTAAKFDPSQTASFDSPNASSKAYYPAFVKAYADSKAKFATLKYSTIKSVDCLNNTFVISKVLAENGSAPQMYDIAITVASGKLNYSIKNAQAMDTAIMMKMSDQELENIASFEFGNIAAALSSDINTVISDNTVYANAKSAFCSNAELLVASVSSLTNITKPDFVKEIKNTPVSITGEITAVDLNTNKTYSGYKYRLTMLIWRPVVKTIDGHLYFYTNSPELSKTPKDATLTFDGTLVDYNEPLPYIDFHIVGK